MALGSHLITVRRLEKYINDVIGKKANLPDTSKTIIGNISQINSDLLDNIKKTTKNTEDIQTIAGSQIPQSTVADAVNNYVSEHSAGFATREEFTDIVNNNSYDLIKTLKPLYNPLISNGITYNISSDNVITANGTAVGNSYYIWYNTANKLPNLMRNGYEYKYVFNSTNTNITFQIFGYLENGNLEQIVGDARQISMRKGEFTIEPKYKGLIVRCLTTTGVSLSNDVITLEIRNADTNASIDERVKRIESCFKEENGADKYIKDLKVYLREDVEIACVNINNARNNITGFGILTVENGSLTTQLYFGTNLVNGSYNKVKLDHNMGFAEFYFDASSIPIGERDITFNDKYIVNEKSKIDLLQFETFIESLKQPVYADLSMFETFGIIGDSYASGEIYTPNGSGGYNAQDYYNLSWGQIMSRMCGNVCTNFSKGGLTTETWLSDNKGLPLLQSESAKQLYICALGINDASKKGTDYIGSASDMGTENNTFYGNYHKIIQAIKSKNQSALIILLTIPQVSWISESYVNAFNDAIIDIANRSQVPFEDISIDSFYKSDFFKNNMVQNHPTAINYSAMGKANKRLLEKCISEHPTYFKEYIG